MPTARRTTPKREFWAVDGYYYGHIKSFLTARDFLTRVYNLTREEDEDHAFFDDWKEAHPLPEFLDAEAERVKRRLYRFSFMDGGGLYLDDAKPGTRGAFELWEWAH